MIINEVTEINEILKKTSGNNVALVTHINPDGDGLGTAIALSICLKKIYEAIPYLIMDSVYPSFMNYLEQANCRIVSYKDYISTINKDFDCLIVLDCHERNRIDCDPHIFGISKKVLMIDHHIVKDVEFMDEYDYYIDIKATSTGIIVHRVVKDEIYKNESRRKEFSLTTYAACIYTSIINDTDNFLNTNLNQETFSVVADLMLLGLQPSIIANKFLNSGSIKYYKFIGNVLSTIEVKGKIAFYYATLKMLTDNGLLDEAYSKMMRWTKGAFDVEITICFQEYVNNIWRVSLRSESYNVAKIAHYFQGGGHMKAAGFKITGEFSQIKEKVLSYIEATIV